MSEDLTELARTVARLDAHSKRRLLIAARILKAGSRRRRPAAWPTKEELRDLLAPMGFFFSGAVAGVSQSSL